MNGDVELTVTALVIGGFAGAVHAVAHHVVDAEGVHLVRCAPVPVLVLVPLVVLAEFLLVRRLIATRGQRLSHAIRQLSKKKHNVFIAV